MPDILHGSLCPKKGNRAKLSRPFSVYVRRFPSAVALVANLLDSMSTATRRKTRAYVKPTCIHILTSHSIYIGITSISARLDQYITPISPKEPLKAILVRCMTSRGSKPLDTYLGHIGWARGILREASQDVIVAVNETLPNLSGVNRRLLILHRSRLHALEHKEWNGVFVPIAHETRPLADARWLWNKARLVR